LTFFTKTLYIGAFLELGRRGLSRYTQQIDHTGHLWQIEIDHGGHLWQIFIIYAKICTQHSQHTDSKYNKLSRVCGWSTSEILHILTSVLQLPVTAFLCETGDHIYEISSCWIQLPWHSTFW